MFFSDLSLLKKKVKGKHATEVIRAMMAKMLYSKYPESLKAIIPPAIKIPTSLKTYSRSFLCE